VRTAERRVAGVKARVTDEMVTTRVGVRAAITAEYRTIRVLLRRAVFDRLLGQRVRLL